MARRKNRKYTAAEKRAFHSGQGYYLGYNGRKIEFKTVKLKESFQAGYADQSKRTKKHGKIYPKIK